MSPARRGPAPGPNETIERHEVVERRDHYAGDAPAERQAAFNLIWLIPLLLVVIGLVWYIFAQGTPRNPAADLELTVPEVELPVVREERRIEIQVPQGGQPAQPQPQAPSGQ